MYTSECGGTTEANGTGWNLQLLNHFFSSDKVEAISKTPFSTMGIVDRMIWSDTKHGQYTVSSGYKVAKLLRRRRREMKALATGKMRKRGICGMEFGV